MKNFLKVFTNYEEYCKYQKENRKNKFLFLLKKLLKYSIILIVWITAIVWFISIASLVFMPLGLLIIPFTSLTFKMYALIIGELFIYAYLSTIIFIFLYNLLNAYIKNKSGLEIEEYTQMIDNWKKRCKEELKKENDYIDVSCEEE